MATPVTETLAAFVAQLRYEQLPADVAQEAKLAIADTVGSALAAAKESVTTAALATVDSHGPASVWGLGRKVGVRDAAFVNGTMAHAHDIDDTNPSMRGHPSAPVVPAVFALAAQQGASGKEAIAAYVAGVEIETKIGRAVNMAHYNKGWHTTLTLGSLGTAAAAANLLKLDAHQTAIALAISASTAGGLVANFGTMTKPVHSGFAADNGVKAALLARAGITANPKALEAKTGFFELFAGNEVHPELALEKLGERWDIVDPGNIYKLYPTCSLTHCAVDMILDGIADGSIRPKEVEAIECAVGYRCENTLPYHDAKTGLEGKFSMEYCLAAALVYGKLGFAQFEDDAVTTPEIAAMHKRIRLYTHPDLRTPESVPYDFTDLTIVHRDGRKFHGRESYAKGDPHKRWSLAQFKGKFVECAEPLMGGAQSGALWDRLQQLEALSGEQLAGLV
ncbi:MmgE/PrpD family protein [Ramlibacter albus]|uniref:MmgE/PrpD family protein n=1 Tax=Ramlibacter albus TaxID=2079448 RepID=A0A923MCY6_9BURK|nr:MmgE/PrpD family protein [Ramlibacter albus]MBC5767109.1 MmgE/PrpD family protein [Ramlibacter albus]